VIDNNVYWDTRAGTNGANLKFSGATLAQWETRGHDTNSIVTDPLFIDALKDDFQIKANSPALKHGFTPIALRDIGIRPKGWRN
jgi:hypothetical protein